MEASMSKTLDDALMSLSRYLSECFPDYELHVAPQEGEFTRPAIVVRIAGDTVFPRGAWHTADIVQPFIIFIYPRTVETAIEAQRQAIRAEHTLQNAVRFGEGRARPHRIPLYDYSDTPLDQPGPLEPEGFLRVDDFNSRREADNEQQTSWRIVSNLRLEWRRIAVQEPLSPLVEALPVTNTDAT
jgi:hypothetical protein